MKARKTTCKKCRTPTCSPDGLCCKHRRTVPRECAKCHGMKPIKSRGICAACYDKLVACVRCGVARKIQRGGICCACIKRGGLDVPYVEFDPEPTQEQVDRTVAEVLAAGLPEWWHKSRDNPRVALKVKEPVLPRIRVVRIRDIGGRIAKRRIDFW